MTKKFWDSWKKRVYQTYRIDLFESVEVNGNLYGKWNLLSHSLADDEIIKATFKDDTVDLVIKQYRYVIGSPSHLHEENLYVTLERTNIRSVEFNRPL